MRRCCEVCESYRPRAELEVERKLVELRFESRRVLLCAGHARIAENSKVRSFDQLRKLYGSGRRSFVPRRAREPNSGAVEQRRNSGRRAGDART